MSGRGLEVWEKAVDIDDVDTAAQWLASCRAAGEKVNIPQLLHNAAFWGAAKIVKLLLGSGAKVDAKDKSRMTALMAAAQGRSSGHHACVECLLEHGANPNARDRTGGTVLMHAFLEAEDDKAEALSVLQRTVTTLLQHGADASNAGDAVVTAAGLETTALLELLLDAGASPSAPPQAPNDAVLQESANELGEDTRKLRATNQKLPTPLQAAIRAKSLAAVRLLLKHGANANDPLTEGRTPLLYAIEKHAVDLVSELVKYGADVSAPQGESEWTPLMWACFKGAPPKIVQALLDHGASIDVSDKGSTALSVAYVN